MGGEESETLYNQFLQQMKSSYQPDLIKGMIIWTYLFIFIYFKLWQKVAFEFGLHSNIHSELHIVNQN